MSGPGLSTLRHDLMGSDAHLLNTTESAYLQLAQQDEEHPGSHSIMGSHPDSLDRLEHAPGVQPPSKEHQNPQPQGVESWLEYRQPILHPAQGQILYLQCAWI